MTNRGNAGRGRTKGSKNVYSRAFKDAVLQVFNDMGGPARLLKWAMADDKHLTEFYKIAARLIPTEVVGGGPQGEHLIRQVIHEHRDD